MPHRPTLRALPWILATLAVTTTAHPVDAGIRDRVRDAASAQLASRVMAGAALRLDVGIEAAVLAGATRDAADVAIGGDLVLAVFADARGPAPPSTRLRDRLLDRVLGPPRARTWPALARPKLEVHAGGVFDLAGGRRQLHLSVGSGLGPVGIGLAGAREWTDAGAAWAVGPELRLRHRFGPRARSPSVGVVARGEIFVDDRATHADRVTLGVFGMFDAF